MQKLISLLNWFNIKRHIAARVFLSIFLSVLLVSGLIIVLYAQVSYRQYDDLQIHNSRNAVDAILAQIEEEGSTIAQAHALLFSSNDIYAYLCDTALDMPSLEWFHIHQSAKALLNLWGRSQTHMILGMSLHRDPQTHMDYGSFHLFLNPYELAPHQLNRLFAQDGHIFYVSALHTANGSKAFIVTQLYDNAFDSMCTSLLGDNSAIMLRDAQGEVLRVYANDAENTDAIVAKLLEEQPANGPWRVVTSVSQATAWTVSLAFPVTPLSALLLKVAPWLLPTMLLALVCALLLSFALSRQLSHGFRTLKANMALMEAEQYGKIERLNGSDELAQTSHAFADMAARMSVLINENHEKDLAQHHLEMQVLRAQVSPHFLYNTLNSVRQLASLQGMDHIERIVASLIQLLRAALSNEGMLVPLSQELEYVNHYCEICQYQYLDSFDLQQRVPPELMDCRVVHMILQPIVENAIIHGLAETGRQGVIRVSAAREGEDLHICVVDNGCGMSEAQVCSLLDQGQNTDKLRFSGIGVRNVHDRVRLRFGAPYGLRITSRKGYYTRVDILLPLCEKEPCQ